ncbi:MAG: exodeoxyribonuclease VII small subunit [Proteobacteria bacterium]|nr:exodeoxyribonuclease VII small subunit [Pseudomonadota bacterium]
MIEPAVASKVGVPEPGFDAILTDLQALVEALESADMPLERSLEAFERGVALARRGQQILDAAERKVELLMRDGSTAPLEQSERG